jgi:hypothetical protein
MDIIIIIIKTMFQIRVEDLNYLLAISDVVP